LLFSATLIAGGFFSTTISAQDSKPAPEAKAIPPRQPDERYKADILLVVAHPDDEGAATAYLARAMDEGKRVAVVYGTRGNSGGNEVGMEQAAALAAIREIEARHSLSKMGIENVWFLNGKDTASQNVLQSLSTWNHGEALQQLVRLVRLTRPEVVLSFLPGTFVGEDHGDPQAAGVLATEAFDLSGDPAAYPEQLAGPTKRLESMLDDLRPWQPKKIYYFPGRRQRRNVSRPRPSVFGEGLIENQQAAVLANRAGWIPGAPDAVEVLRRFAQRFE
jgi:LmbE family N-acetylglucosaminyl deacetylase